MKITLLYLCVLFNIKYVALKDIEDDEDIIAFMSDINYKTHLKDPNDMLAVPKSASSVKRKDPHYPLNEDLNDRSCVYENHKIKQCHKEFDHCSSEVDNLKTQLKDEKELVLTLQKKLLNSSKTDVNSFYLRILRKFWTFLEMEKNESFLRKGNEAIINRLIVSITAADIAAFKRIFAGENTYGQIDGFFSQNFEVEEMSDGEDFIQITRDFIFTFVTQFKYIETWLYMLWTLMLIVAIWAFYLFMRDIQRELRWRKLIFMLFFLAFLISCIFHWRHMIKVRESKRQSYLMSMNRGTNCNEDQGYLKSFKIYLLGGQTECEKYHENLMVSPEEEISPMMVVSEAASQFFLLPLKDVGHNFGLFFNSFYGNLPLLYQIPATLFFLILFTISMMSWFGYGIYFPFWLGGIRPSKSGDNYEKMKEVMNESQKKIAAENRVMIEEAKVVLAQISDFAISQVQNPASHIYLESIVENSMSTINKRLECLIERKLMMTSLERENYLHNFKPATKDKMDGKISMELAAQSPMSWKIVNDRSLQTSPSLKCNSKSSEPFAKHDILTKFEIVDREESPSLSNCSADSANNASDVNSFIMEVRAILSEGSSPKEGESSTTNS